MAQGSDPSATKSSATVPQLAIIDLFSRSSLELPHGIVTAAAAQQHGVKLSLLVQADKQK